MGNVYVGAGCNLAGQSVVGLGCWLDRQVTIDHSVRLGSCVTLQCGVTLGRDVVVGKGTTLSTGSFALKGTKIGHHCEWLLGGQLPEIIPDQSFFDRLMPDGARILKNIIRFLAWFLYRCINMKLYFFGKQNVEGL